MGNAALTKRESNKIDCRERILKASRRLFISKGYDETMVEDIAQCAGVSKATVYNYFPNKESLLVGTADMVSGKMYHLYEKLKAQGLPEKELMRQVLFAFVIENKAYSDLGRRVTFLTASSDSSLYKLGSRVRAIFVEIIKTAIEKGTALQTCDVERLADSIMGIYFVSQFSWHDFESIGTEEIEKRVNTMFSDAVSAFFG